jgi:hypothetical protein
LKRTRNKLKKIKIIFLPIPENILSTEAIPNLVESKFSSFSKSSSKPSGGDFHSYGISYSISIINKKIASIKVLIYYGFFLNTLGNVSEIISKISIAPRLILSSKSSISLLVTT